MKRLISLVLLLAMLGGIVVPAMPLHVQAKGAWITESFESSGALNEWHAQNGSAKISQKRSKLDSSSLQWTYKSGSTLTATYPEFSSLSTKKSGHGVKFWVYNEKPVNADMTVKIGTGSSVRNEPRYRFTVHMDFTGWRAVWVRLNQVASTGSKQSNIDTMQIEMPKAMGSGEVYIDAFEITDNVPHYVCADYQLPYLPMHETGVQYQSYLRVPERFPDETITQEQKDAFQTIVDRLQEYLIPQNSDVSGLDAADPRRIRYESMQALARQAVETYDREFHIQRRSDGTLTGPGLFASRENIGAAHKKFVDLEQIWVGLAFDYKLNHNESSKTKLLDLFDFAHDQGWAEGSSCGCMRYDEIRAAGYAYAVFLMRDELKATGRWDRELANLRWRSEFGSLFIFDDPDFYAETFMSCDDFRSTALLQMMYIICMEDSSLKTGYMKAYLDYLHQVMAPSNNGDSRIKNDFTLWHHQGPYMASYGQGAVIVLSQVKYLLHDTVFDMDAASTEVLSKVMQAYWNSAYRNDLPVRLRGRMPQKNGTAMDVLPAYGFLAASGDQKMAEIFLNLWDTTEPQLQDRFQGNLPNLAWMETPGQMNFYVDLAAQVKSQGVQPALEPVGDYVYPFGGYMIHRQPGWALMCSGWNQYFWDYEGTASENVYGRYANYGSAMIVPAEGFVSGGLDFTQGWDWNRWPGTTTKYLPNSELMTSSSHRHLSDEPFLGGVSSEGGSGIYAMNLHDTYFDSSFRAKKSWFCFGNEIICLGSSISNSDADHNTETTLFQNVIGENTSAPIYVNGQKVTQFPYSKAFRAGDRVWLTDPYGNGYISFGSGQLHIEKNVQRSNLEDGQPSSGNVAVAYLSHGKAPRGGEYEYVILPASTPDEVAKLAQNKDYQVLQHNDSAHIVQSNRTGGIGYVLFSAGNKLNAGQLKSVNVPAVVMERSLNSNELLIDFSDPDLRVSSGTPDVQKEPGRTQKATVIVRGKWLLEKDVPGMSLSYKGQDTVLTFTCKAGEQFDVALCKEIKPQHSFTAQTASPEYLKAEATCLSPAVYYTSCRECGLSSRGTEFEATFTHGEADPHNHTDIVVIPGKNATCTETGLTDGKRCDACGAVIEEQKLIPVQTHSFTAQVAKAEYLKSEATCQTSAVYYKSCAECGTTSQGTEQEATFTHGKRNPQNHTSVVTVPGREATCTETGLTEGKHCEACGRVVVAQTVISMKAHDFTAHKAEGKYLAAEADCQTAASYYTSCAVCGASSKGTEQEEIFSYGEPDAHKHTHIVVIPGREATCAETGLTDGKRCEACGAVIEEQELIPVQPHSFTAQVADAEYLKSEATCHSPAVYFKSCTMCGKTSQGTEQEATFNHGKVNPDNHTAVVVVPGREATCTETGLTEGKRCDACGRTIVAQTIIPMKAHDFTAHRAEEKYLASEANCQTAASYYTSCAVCGASSKGTEQEAIFFHGEKNPHKHSSIIVIPGRDSTCTETGLTAGQRCADCGVVIAEQQIIPMKQHVYAAEKAEPAYLKSEATCHSTAVYFKSCAMCGKTSQGTAQETTFNHGKINLDNHTAVVVVPGREATCTETGLTEGKRCNDCGRTIVAQTVIPMKAHDFTAHRAEEQYLSSGTDCQTAAGYYTSCAVCGASSRGTEQEEIFSYGEPDAHKHTHVVVLPGKAATCTETGLTAGRRCTDCGTVITEQQIIPMQAHRFTKRLTQQQYLKAAATCHSDAVYYLACEHCGTSAEGIDESMTWTRTGTKLPHSFTHYIPNQDATCTKNGTETAVCDAGCGAADTREIPNSKIDHIDENKDHKCDMCGQKMPGTEEHCDCLCHGTSFFDKLRYQSELFFWKLAGTNKVCKCGARHY